MLFNSLLFILIFLPITLLGFYIIGIYFSKKTSKFWLVGASLTFYAWWNFSYVFLVIFSILLNYFFGISLQKYNKKILLILGIAVNLALLGYFKYANFFVENLNILLKGDLILENIILPLAISFFTFQQITFLIDSFRGKVRETNILNYSLFVLFFPQLIAGPIVHHNEMMPQFLKSSFYKLSVKNLTIGLSIFFVGLFKKVVLADGISIYSNSVFDAAQIGAQLTFFEAWGGALAYSMQLYFDFSGYSDMAIGLARIFGVVLPINFFSPYKASNIIEFWRRWHITLSRFLRDNVYIPLGGNKRGLFRRYINLTITMLLGGFWHGAGWTFIIWGGLHGFYLVVNHFWNWLRNKISFINQSKNSRIRYFFGWLITFLCVVFGWVIFRADSVNSAIEIYKGMFMLNGVSIPHSLVGIEQFILNKYPEFPIVAGGLGSFGSASGIINIIILFLIAIILPNTLEWMENFKPALGSERYTIHLKNKMQIRLKFSKLDCLFIAMLIYTTFIYMTIESVNEFLYFNF